MRKRGWIEKRLLDPRRVRRIADGFSWIDRRFVRDWIERLSRDEILLYLFLVCVADKDGLSYYSDARISGALKIESEALGQARLRLLERGLIAYEPPLYQVLAIESALEWRKGGPAGLGEIFRAIARPSEEPRP